MSPAWRIYYDDGSTFDSDQGAPWEAPGLGVVCIVVPDPEVGRLVLARFDWYLYRTSSGWWGHDQFGLFDHLTSDRAGDIRAVKAGRTIGTPEYRDIFTRASRDPGFLPKSGRHPDERSV